MSLPIQADNLIKVGILHQESHSADEVAECLKLADSHLQVAKASQFDTKVRYLNGYEAVFQVATAGLRALDLRPSQKQGSRTQTIQSLAWTLAVDARLMPVLKWFPAGEEDAGGAPPALPWAGIRHGRAAARASG